MERASPITRFLLVLASFVVVVAGMRAAEAILVPFLLSLFIAVIATPPLLWLKKRGIPSVVAMLLIIAAIVIVSVLVGLIVGSSINDFRQDLPEYQQRLSALTADVFLKMEGFGLSFDVEQLRQSINPSKALGLVGNTLATFGNMMTNALLILLTVTFILAEEVRFADKLRFSAKHPEKTLEAISRFTHAVNQYMAIKTLMSLLTGFLILVWLWFLGLEYFVLWGLLAFLLNYIPTFGSILAAIPAVLLALIKLGVGDAVLVAAGFLAVNFVVGNILEPRVMGKGLDLSPLVVFLSLVFWGWVLGSIGMLLSIPLTMTVKIALESFDDTRWIGIMMGSGNGVYEFDQDVDTIFALPNEEPKADNK